jgi:hypothetical protein
MVGSNSNSKKRSFLITIAITIPIFIPITIFIHSYPLLASKPL